MGVILIERTNDEMSHYCHFCRECSDLRGSRHVHFLSLDSFLEYYDQKRKITQAEMQKKRSI
jgi:hypothetical protein